MDWKKIAGPVATIGGGLLGEMIAGDRGGALGERIGGKLAEALGSDATPEGVIEAITQEPASAAVVLQEAQADPAIAAMIDAQRDVALGQQALMAEEMVTQDPMQRRWRPFFAFAFTGLVALQVVVICYLAIMAPATLGMVAAALTPLLGPINLGGFGTLGTYTWGRTKEKTATITGLV